MTRLSRAFAPACTALLSAALTLSACGTGIGVGLIGIGGERSRYEDPGATRAASAISPDVVRLADVIDTGGPEAQRALREVFRRSGIPVVDDSRRQVAPGGFGVGIYLLEVENLLSAIGGTPPLMSLEDLGSVLSGIPELSGASPTTFLQQALAEGSADTASDVRFWAEFIAERSRRRMGSIVRTAADATADVTHLDPLQISLILRRIANEVLMLSVSGPETGNLRQHPLLRQVQYSPGRNAFVPAPGPCDFEGTESLVVSAAEGATSYAFKKLLKYLADKGVSGAQGYLTTIKIAQPILNNMKLLAAMTAVRVEMNARDLPILRTEGPQPIAYGSQARFAATVIYEVGSIQALNCARLALANVGIKFSVPQRGPVENAGVTVLGRTGFGLPFRSEQFVQFARGQRTALQTDRSGQVSFAVDGAGQNRTIPSSAQRTVRRTAEVELQIQLTQANIFKDLLAAYSSQVSPVAFLKVPIELLYRTRWILNFRFPFEVMDFATGYRFERLTLDWRTPGGESRAIHTWEDVWICPADNAGSGWRAFSKSWTYRVIPGPPPLTVRRTIYFPIGQSALFDISIEEGDAPKLRATFRQNPNLIPGHTVVVPLTPTNDC